MVNPDSLGLVIHGARSGAVSPYKIKLSQITGSLLENIIETETIQSEHLESLEKAAHLLQMKAEFVANGGKFVVPVRESVFKQGQAAQNIDSSFEAMIQLKEMIQKSITIHSFGYPHPQAVSSDPESIVMPSERKLVSIISRLASDKKESDKKQLVVRRVTINLKQAMSEILEWLKKDIQILFSMLLGKSSSRIDVITRLLALLQLMKLSKVNAWQSEPFGPIMIEKL
jgi:chromatin segregation and condensation protein Rec8/ScpA/Scc1 (kleisin family)